MPELPPRFESVAPEDLRKRFNDGGYWERAQRGELLEVIVEDGHPSPPSSGEPTCTRSQYVIYLDPEGNKIAEVHQYVRPDGDIGASGRPDPKALLEEGTVYHVAAWRLRS